MMDKINRDTYELKEEIITMLDREKHIVLATYKDGNVRVEGKQAMNIMLAKNTLLHYKNRAKCFYYYLSG